VNRKEDLCNLTALKFVYSSDNLPRKGSLCEARDLIQSAKSKVRVFAGGLESQQ